MKIQITESDIRNMTLDVIKRVIFENLDVRDKVHGLDPEVVMDAYEAAFGRSKEELMNGDMYQTLQSVYDTASPEAKAAFEKALNGGGNEIPDIDFNDNELLPFITETIEKVVKTKLNEGSRESDTIAAALNWDNEVKAWNNRLMELKNEIWKGNGGRNTPELELAFDAMRLLSTADSWFVNPYCQMLRTQRDQQLQEVTDYGCNIFGSASMNPSYEERYGVNRDEYYAQSSLVYDIVDKFGDGRDRVENYTNRGIVAYFYGKMSERPEVYDQIKKYCAGKGYNATCEDMVMPGFNPHDVVKISFQKI